MDRLCVAVYLTLFFMLMVAGTMAVLLFPSEEFATNRLLAIAGGWGLFFACFLGYMTHIVNVVIEEIKR